MEHFICPNLRLIPGRQSFRKLWGLFWRGTWPKSWQKVSAIREEQIAKLMVLVLGMETCKTRFVTFSPENIYLGAGSANFPRARSALSWSSSWIPFRMYCRSATTVAMTWFLRNWMLPFDLNFNHCQVRWGLSWYVTQCAVSGLKLC